MRNGISVCLFVLVALSLGGVSSFASAQEMKPIVETSRAYGPRQMGAGAAHRDVAQTYDLYRPSRKENVSADAPFFLFIHGGAWMGGSKESDTALMMYMAERGVVCASMNYALAAPDKSGAVTFVDMLRDIDLMVSHVAELFKELGLPASTRLAIGGASAGGHLALLYAYDGANPSALGLGLKHALPIACVFSDGGPTDMASKEFEIAGRAGRQGQEVDEARQIAWISMLSGGSLEETNFDVVRHQLGRYSPVALITDKVPRTIALYGEIHQVPGTTIGTDGIVTSQNFHALTNRLSAVGVPYAAKLTRYPHCQALGRDAKIRAWLLLELKAGKGSVE